MAQVFEFLRERLGYDEAEVRRAVVTWGRRDRNAKGDVTQIDVITTVEAILKKQR